MRRGTIDSFPLEVYGDQAGAAFNGHFGIEACHPIVASFSLAGDYNSARDGFRLANGLIHFFLLRNGEQTEKDGAACCVVLARRCRRRNSGIRLDTGRWAFAGPASLHAMDRNPSAVDAVAIRTDVFCRPRVVHTLTHGNIALACHVKPPAA